MKDNKKLMTVLVALCALLMICAVWMLATHHVVGWRLYPKDAAALDLRGQNLSIANYEKLRKKMPQTLIRWNVPFQGGTVADDTKELTVTTLTEGDLDALDHLPELETVHAESCTDYEMLWWLRQRRPEVQLHYCVNIDGQAFAEDTAALELGGITMEELSLLCYLPDVKSVTVTGGDRTENLLPLQDHCREWDIGFFLRMGGQDIPWDIGELEVACVTEEELNFLAYLPDLERLHLENPEAPAESILALKERYPHLQLTWSVDFGAVTVRSTDDMTEIDLSGAGLDSLEQVKAGMAYFPDAEVVFLGDCDFENEDLARLRNEMRPEYKVVWMVDFNGKLPSRTDIKDFSPGRDGVYRFNNDDAYNLRYCEEIVCMDIGHMTVRDVDFLAFMPDIEYLILAHTEVQYIDAISNCKKLKFLELDWSCIRDVSPLVGCTGLEDLNIGETWVDATPIFEMTWLKNLYMIHGNKAQAWQASQAMPDTRVVASGPVTVGSGWRRLPNYYAMRDYLGVPYMN